MDRKWGRKEVKGPEKSPGGQGVRVPYRADKIPDQGIISLESEVILHFLGSQAMFLWNR